ncbi:24730_t:CDS:2, partial [Dentiscutata erythropus]
TQYSATPPSNPPNKSIKNTPVFVKNIVKRLTVGKIILGIISMDLVIAECRRRYSDYTLFNAFATGSKKTLEEPPEKFIPREKIVNKIKTMLTPDKEYSLYRTISGSHGVGKSTLVRKAAKKVSRGVIYVDVPANFENFGDEFAKALNISFDKPISLTSALLRKICGIPLKSGISQDPKWVRALDSFKRGAETYLKTYGKPAVIIYDNVNRLALKNPKLLDVLQDDAKDHADVSEYITLFVTSEGTVKRMQGRSSWSRATRTFEIGDMTKVESMDYLVNKSGIPLREAEQFYNLLGGRIEHLITAVDLFAETPSFEECKETLVKRHEATFTEAGINPGGRYHDIAKKVVNVLLEKGQIGFLEYHKIVNDAKVANFLLATNIFSYHPEKSVINFHSKIIEFIIREKIVEIV